MFSASAFYAARSLAPRTEMEYMKLRLPNQLPFFVAMVVSLTFPVKAPHGPSGAGEQTNKSHPKFTDATFALGLNFRNMASHTSKKYLIETMGAGVALFDYDNDGRLDIFVVNGAPLPDPTPKGAIPLKTGLKYWNRLYHQKPDGTFEDVTEKAGLEGVGYGMGVAVGDYDNDGNEDLYVTAYGGNKLYHNNGDGTFTDVTEKAGVGGSGWSTSAAWVDLDGDGFLDLVVLRYLVWDFDDIWCGEHQEGYRAYCQPDYFKPIAPLVYHNGGNGQFTEVTEKIGMAKPGKGLGLAIADYDRDGHIDLFVANDSMSEFLYRNNGDGTFTYESYPSGIGRMSMAHSGWGVRLLDYDNNGWRDLLIAQGHDLDTIELTYPNLRYREPMLLARNTGHSFEDVSAEAGSVFREAWVGRGLAIGDIDNDGRLDAVVTTNDGPLYVLHNGTSTPNHWLILKLVGHRSNRDAIGAEVRVVTGRITQIATVTTASSYLSSSDKRVHFGLGTETAAATVEIRWPSGIRQTLKSVRGDQILQVDEPSLSAGERKPPAQ